ncbi:site-specific tyrosine recombinase XerD [Streptococcus pseudoporcinus]|uniref:Tyrosine recombinase XerD-like n=1 Tax=Streptococcus pseudoporcinus LQ 940-04 TaxID=875093 RepID=G5K8M8_9STRE|nr:site-specific tyrosine recombinase XerD [Streptococcus pseudoporcinus]EFR43913.1 site-specific tyrosine recombinase XerD-like protein [Streptococcus pseudoporcinus SPIN 20026]EHI64968.1 site-specific tyrosine recombinase XerD-like protein [Streptococcus pseudoporcinus LQ 940-04]VEF94325.1 tyrosine recombinase XerD [Streptococcus pseudoporcinus]
MINLVEAFLEQKDLSDNTKLAYRYDLLQFVNMISEKLNQERLTLYQQQIAHLSKSAKRRKFSTVNQFLLFLYQTGNCNVYLRIDEKISQHDTGQIEKPNLDRELFYQASTERIGQTIALLILELGLLPSEIAMIKVVDCSLTFQSLRIYHQGNVRVLQLPKVLLPFLEPMLASDAIFLFDHNGQAFSRQWFFTQLKAFLTTIGYSHLNAQDLRHHYILKEKANGKSLLELSQLLGLKSPITLEKYYKM